jgi:hypothetical protein
MVKEKERSRKSLKEGLTAFKLVIIQNRFSYEQQFLASNFSRFAIRYYKD